MDFRTELCNLINKYNIENTSNTPDYILTDYLIDCLKLFSIISEKRDKYHNFNLKLFSNDLFKSDSDKAFSNERNIN